MVVNSGGQQRQQGGGVAAAAVVPSPTSGRPGVVRTREAGWDRWREQLSAAGDVLAHAEVSQQQEPWVLTGCLPSWLPSNCLWPTHL